MNWNLITGIFLLYLGVALSYSEYRRILIGRALDGTIEELLELITDRRYIIPNYIFKPVIYIRHQIENWREDFEE